MFRKHRVIRRELCSHIAIAHSGGEPVFALAMSNERSSLQRVVGPLVAEDGEGAASEASE